MNFLQGQFPSLLLIFAASSVPLGASNAEQDACIPREWAISVVDPNVLDADSYGADTSIFVDDLGRPRIFYAKVPVNIDDWLIRLAIQQSASWRIQKLPADPGSARPSVALDHLGRYHLAYRTGVFFGQGILRYGRIEQGLWHEEIVDEVQGGTSDASIAVDAR